MRIAPRSAPAPPRRSWLRSAAPPSPSSVGPATPTSRPASATTATIPSPPSSVSASRHQGDYEKTLPVPYLRLRPRRLAAILAAASAFLCPALIFPCSEFALGPSLFEVICLLCGFQTGRLDGRRYQ